MKHNSTLKQLMREFNTQLAQKDQELEMAVKETISKLQWYTLYISNATNIKYVVFREFWIAFLTWCSAGVIDCKWHHPPPVYSSYDNWGRKRGEKEIEFKEFKQLKDQEKYRRWDKNMSLVQRRKVGGTFVETGRSRKEKCVCRGV